MSTVENLKYNFIKPLVSAGVGGFVLRKERGGDTFNIDTGLGLPFDGKSLSPMTFGALLGFGSSFLIESISNVTNAIDKKHKTKHLASFLTHSLGGMASWALATKVLNPGATSDDCMQMAQIGLAAEIFSQWFHENFIEEDSFGSDVLDLL